ncbi:hypothetical protein Tsubulata_045771, partial [Turnera subulata]
LPELHPLRSPSNPIPISPIPPKIPRSSYHDRQWRQSFCIRQAHFSLRIPPCTPFLHQTLPFPPSKRHLPMELRRQIPLLQRKLPRSVPFLYPYASLRYSAGPVYDSDGGGHLRRASLAAPGETGSWMHRVGGDGERPNFRTLEGGFQACGNLGASGEGSCLHCLAVKTGLEHSQVVKSSLLSMYSKCGNVQAAYHSFCEVKDKDLFSWTSYSGVHPDEIVLCCMLLGFGNSMRVSEGKAFHGLIIRRNYAMDRMVYNAVLSMYCRFGLLGPAEILFFMGSEQNKESWNIMVSGYAKMGLPEKCTYLFRKMQSLCMEADSSSFVSVISSCSQLGVRWLFRSLHCHIIKNSMAEDISISNSLIDMYGKGGSLRLAWTIFWRTKKDIVTWNTMISLCTRNGHYVEAIDLFDEMISANWEPNPATLVTVLSAYPSEKVRRDTLLELIPDTSISSPQRKDRRESMWHALNEAADLEGRHGFSSDELELVAEELQLSPMYHVISPMPTKICSKTV